MTISLHPWANGPFELILHAEGHLTNGDDFDRRIALISFDNAIEVSITTYLALHPIQRGNRTYARADIDKWLNNYHSKLEFLDEELRNRSMTWAVDRSHIIWAHDHRNQQYHGGANGTPEKRVLDVIRRSALWVFSVLFDVNDPEDVLAQHMAAHAATPLPRRDVQLDRAIDNVYGFIHVAGQQYYTSEILFSFDATAYRDLGQRLCAVLDESKEDNS